MQYDVTSKLSTQCSLNDNRNKVRNSPINLVYGNICVVSSRPTHVTHIADAETPCLTGASQLTPKRRLFRIYNKYHIIQARKVYNLTWENTSTCGLHLSSAVWLQSSSLPSQLKTTDTILQADRRPTYCWRYFSVGWTRREHGTATLTIRSTMEMWYRLLHGIVCCTNEGINDLAWSPSPYICIYICIIYMLSVYI